MMLFERLLGSLAVISMISVLQSPLHSKFSEQKVKYMSGYEEEYEAAAGRKINENHFRMLNSLVCRLEIVKLVSF